MKIKLHFNRVNMQRKSVRVWSAHTSKSCNMSEEVLIRVNGEIIGKTVFKEDGKQPRAHIQFQGDVVHENGATIIDVSTLAARLP